MALLNEPITIGSAAEVSQRLLLWAKRDGSGLARVEYSSEFSRQQVVQTLQTALAEAGISLTVIELPTHQTAPEVVQFLLQKLSTISGGVVSVSGFAGAFQAHDRLESSLRVINFNREALTAFPLRQIWWMTPVLLQISLHAMPDLHGWFSPQLTLAQPIQTQSIQSSQGDLLNPLVFAKDDGRPLRSNIDDARQRSDRLLTQLAAAQSAGATDIDLLTTYLLPALESLAEVGAQKELRRLTSKFEELLDPLKLLSAATKRGDSPANIATHLNTLANLYESQGRYGEAEPLYVKALDIRKAELGDRHLSTATSLNTLANLYYSLGRYGEAKPLYLEALKIRKAELGDRHPDTASSLNNLAGLYDSQGRYGEAEPLLFEALDIRKAELGDRHPDTASSLNNLAGLYESQGRYGEAEPLLLEALEIKEAELGNRHPDTASSLNNLAGLYGAQGRYREAEPLLLEALDIRKAELGDRHPDTATSLLNLAALYHQTQRQQKALSCIQQALDIYIPILGIDHPNTKAAMSWQNAIQQAIDESS